MEMTFIRKPNIMCDVCKKPFYKRPKDIKGCKNHFCSRDCYITFMHNSNSICCEFCGKSFWRKSSRERAKFCSRECANRSRRGIFYDGTQKSSHVGHNIRLKSIILESFPNECSICGLGPIWNNKPITLQIDHIDGNRKNDSPDNIRLLCPNCHSQTETYGSKNISKFSMSRSPNG